MAQVSLIIVRPARTVGRIARALFLLMALAISVPAQQNRSAPEDRTPRDKAQQQDMNKREMQLRNSGMPPADKTDPPRKPE